MAESSTKGKGDMDQIQVAPDAASLADEEKIEKVIQIGNIRVLGLTPEDEEFYINFPPEKRSKLIRNIDLRLAPMLSILYLLSNLDRTNIGNASIEGLSEDLGLTGVQYNWCLSIVFVTYVTCEVPSNLLLKKFKRPSYYIGIIVTCWGIVMTLHGVVQNFGGLMTVRLLLGLFEAGFYPGAVYICTQWYMPNEVSTRIAYLYLMSALASAFSGLLAAAIAGMDGVGGYAGWRWIFILEGLATVVLGVMCFFLLLDSPRLSKWLSAEEVRYLEIQNFIKDGGQFGEKTSGTTWKTFRSVLADWKIWGTTALLFVNVTAGYGVKLTMPAIIKGMGFENKQAQLMTAPPYIAGAIATVVASKLSDRFYKRMPFIVIPWIIYIIGYAVIMSYGAHTDQHVGPSYFSVFLVCIGLFPVNPAITSWMANNVTPASKRAVGVAFYLGTGNIGGILGSFMFLSREAPAYPTGYGTSVGVLVAGIFIALGLEAAYWYLNKQKSLVSEEEIRAKYTEQELSDLGDRSPLYKYTL